MNLPFEILKTLAWLAPLRTDQLRRIVAPGMRSQEFTTRVLARLQAQGLIELVCFQYTRGRGHRLPQQRIPPRPLGKVWQISPRGFAELASASSAPQRPALVRQSVLDHDLMLSEVVARVVEQSRPILSSLYVEHEERLDEGRRRPVADAMMVVRYEPELAMPGVVPWKSMPPAPDESVRLYAIEVDRGTEEYSITDEKATNYRMVRNDPTFYARYGRMFPVVLITVPGEARLRRWQAGWRERWPEGKWLITTDAQLAHDEWFEYDGGRERWRSFVDSWQPQATVRRGAATNTDNTQPAARRVTAWWADSGDVQR